MIAGQEATATFDCFGSTCTIVVSGDTPERSAEESVELARESLLDWHERFTRFRPDSELSRLNDDPRDAVPVSPIMARFAQAVIEAGSMTGGLVDATLIDEIESAGYRNDLPHPLPLQMALKLAPQRRSAHARPTAGWRHIDVDFERGIVTRPPGLKLDSGGLAKGMFADVLGETLAAHDSYAINCAGDLTIGGTALVSRPINVESPFDGHTLHTFERARAGVATSGIGRRSWLDTAGAPAHHLLDPASGKPAFTGVVQVTALAPSALLAEIHAKAAVLSGPRLAPARLPHGGVIVFDDGSHRVIAPPPLISLRDLSALTHSRASCSS
ncbi:MAG: FAD:protein FMN transferase [Solirubrobacteraceae bacterium]